jgi:type IV secretion system protein VirB9
MRLTTLALSLLASTALAAPALAEAAPTSVSATISADANRPRADLEDQNMRSQDYRPGVRTRLVVAVGRSFVLTFGPAEQIVHIIIGDGNKTLSAPGGAPAGGGQAAAPQAPLRNNLPMWVEAPGYTTLQIITQVAGGQEPDRAYQFTVQAKNLPADCADEAVCEDREFTYGLIFRYPDDERRKREAAAAARREQARARAAAAAPLRAESLRLVRSQVAAGRLAVDYFGAGAACRNWLYEGEANEAGRAFIPEKVTDNGQETAFLFPGDRPLPAFFVVNADGTEATVLPIMKAPDTAVLPTTARQIRLRGPGAVVYIYNRNPEFGRNCDPGTGTTSPDVVRVVRHAARRS